MDNKDLENNVEFQKASKPEYYDNYLKEYVGYDYTKIKNKKDAREYRKNIKEQYKGLRYYDITVTRDGNSVIYDTVINYEKLDMDKLREIEPDIEGQDDIYKNNKLMLKTWWEFSKDMGMTCKGV